MGKPETGRNQLLACLSRADLQRLEPHLQPYEMRVREEIEASDVAAYAYFPIDGVISLVTAMEDGTTVESATVGNEGMFGLPLLVDTGTDSFEAFVQIPGRALRIRGSVLRSEIARGGALKRLLELYASALFHFISRSAACNSTHTLRQRCAKWLLLAHDRVAGNSFLLTQEFLANMLGVRRATVTVAAGLLRKAGLIEYRNGRIEILNRKGLEAAACECYAVLRGEFDRLAATANGKNRS